MRRWNCARPASRCRSSSSSRSRRSLRPRPCATACRSPSATRPLLDRTPGGRSGRRPCRRGAPRQPRGGSPIHVEVETGLGRGGFDPADVVAASGRYRRQSAGAACRPVVASPSRPASRADRRASTSVSRAAAGASGGSRRGACRTRHLAASGGLLAATSGPVRRRPGRHRHVRHRARRPGRRRGSTEPPPPGSGRPCRSGPGRCGSPGWCPARASATARRSSPPAGAASPRCRSATPTAIPRSLSNKAQVLVRGMRVPQVGTVAMDAIMVDVTDVPGPAGDRRRRVHSHRGAGRRTASASLEVAQWGNTISHESHGGDVGEATPGVLCGSRGGRDAAVACDASRGWGGSTDRPVEASEDEPGPRVASDRARH